MSKFVIAGLAGLALLFAALAVGPAQAEDVKTLRGDVALTADKAPGEMAKVRTDQKKIDRTFVNQPPMIPHTTEKYQINLKENRCLKCHDKANFKDEDAPMAGKSHYVDPDGKEGNKISMKRYFCDQCHAVQTDAKPLVENVFQGVVK